MTGKVVITQGHLPTSNSNASPAIRSTRIRYLYITLSLLLFAAFLVIKPAGSIFGDLIPSHSRPKPAKTCLQVPALRPTRQNDKLSEMEKYLESEAFRNISVMRLSGAVQIPTESFDDLGPVGKDERWEIMGGFAEYLKQTFVKVHEVLELEMVNTHGLLYTWQGTNQSLKPNLLMAHQDVVPVPKSTVDAWTHPPFSGFYDGESVWGRGSSDCKNQLMGILDAVEELVIAGFEPQRTLVLSFGFDEEISGPDGAGYLAPFLLDRYGKDGIAAIVDEGAAFTAQWGVQAALPAVGEKGYLDVSLTIRMNGGHSSVPPDHTSIGVMSELISLIEAHRYRTSLDDSNPILGLLTCGAEHAPHFPSKLKKLLYRRLKGAHSCKKKSKKDDLALEAAKQGPATRYLMQTSIAADVIEGGQKSNNLPERVTALINHRINIGEHTSIVRQRIAELANGVAEKYNLTLHAFDSHNESANSITLRVAGVELEPAPISPTDASILSPWSVLSGTIKALYGEDIIVAPGLMTGNTDTKYYWDLTKHIFRFTAGWDGKSVGFGNIHTVDERIPVESHINMVRWMSTWIRNMDESQLE